MSNNDPRVLDLAERIKAMRLNPAETRDLLGAVAGEVIELPNYSTLARPSIELVHKAAAASGVLLTFKEKGVDMAVVLKAGSHYASMIPPGKSAYMITGGILNLKNVEQPKDGALRELDEELINDRKEPVLDSKKLKDRMKIVDAIMLAGRGDERRLVIGHRVELNEREVIAVKSHIALLQYDEAYRMHMSAQTHNIVDDKPEVETVEILPLKDIVAGKYHLLYSDQMSLFEKAQSELSSRAARR